MYWQVELNITTTRVKIFRLSLSFLADAGDRRNDLNLLLFLINFAYQRISLNEEEDIITQNLYDLENKSILFFGGYDGNPLLFLWMTCKETTCKGFFLIGCMCLSWERWSFYKYVFVNCLYGRALHVLSPPFTALKLL